MTQTAVTEGCNEQFPREAVKSDEMRKDSTFERHGIRLTGHELVATMRRRLACHIGTAFAPLYRL